MLKTMIVMTRRADLTQEEFVAWWTGHHAQLAVSLPKIRRVVLNAATVDDLGGIAELWFDGPEDFSAALGSEAGQAALADAQAMTSDLKLVPVIEHELAVPLN